MLLENFRSTKSYKFCGRIGIFALPLCLIIAKWCKLVGGVAWGPAFVGLMTLVPISLFFGITYLALTLSAIEQAKKENLCIKTNIIADVGYIMYLIFMLYGWTIWFRL